MIWNHPTETTFKKLMFQVPGLFWIYWNLISCWGLDFLAPSSQSQRSGSAPMPPAQLATASRNGFHATWANRYSESYPLMSWGHFPLNPGWLVGILAMAYHSPHFSLVARSPYVEQLLGGLDHCSPVNVEAGRSKLGREGFFSCEKMDRHLGGDGNLKNKMIICKK